MEEPPPPSELIEYAQEVKNNDYFLNQIEGMVPLLRNNLLVGGKSRKRYGSKKKQTRRYYGGTEVSKVKIATYTTIVVIIAALGVQTISLAFFGDIVEWLQNNPNFFYENIMKTLISVVLKQATDAPIKFAFQKICEGLKSVPDAVNALWSIYTKSLSIKSGQEKLSPQNKAILNKSIKKIMNSVNVMQFQVPCGSITFKMDNSITCTKTTYT